MSSFVTKITTSIRHFICDHDTRGLHYNRSVLMLEGERLACDWLAMDAASDSVSHTSIIIL